MNLRVLGLVAVVACAVVVPLTASGAVGDGDPSAVAVAPVVAPAVAPVVTRADAPEPQVAAVWPIERCGPQVTSPEGIEAQTCVLEGARDIRGRTYYRNTTGRAVVAVLSLMGPRGRTVQTHCAIVSRGVPATCETPRGLVREERREQRREQHLEERREQQGGEHLREDSEYLAMAEFAASGAGPDDVGAGRLLLRSGSNSPTP
ncbi:hypothetical protein ACIOEX_07525 [Streptomyces sp. NPDC087850]|uniref:hypothetical protein n=1 Tax=Streptomyces sp. NPDC087850 TaxID=3365809 RepID=UPI003807C606